MTTVWNTDKTQAGKIVGEIDDGCPMEGCNGTFYSVEWPDGETTECCSGGMDELPNGDLHITS